MNDILPPRRPRSPRPTVQRPVTASPSPSRPPVVRREPTADQPEGSLDRVVADIPPAQPLEPLKKQKKTKSKLLVPAIVAGITALACLIGSWYWYSSQLRAVEPGSTNQVQITIPSGVNSAAIADILKKEELIRSTTAFEWYVRINNQSGNLQTGTYRLSKGSDVPDLVDHITKGKVDSFSITFLPGNRLSKHRQGIIDAGFSQQSVDAALSKSYSHPLLASKPDSLDLEGYIYGETYEFPADTTPEKILTRTFDEMYAVVKKENLVQLYKKQGLTLHEGITLASIIQKEVTDKGEMAQAAQVFYLRLADGMPLGSDPTYQYIADKMGQERDLNFDSPYNTRRYAGIPPGPISSPGEGALYAVAHPAKGDFMYFVSGDDDKTYFSRTNEEHEANVRQHCIKKCQIL